MIIGVALTTGVLIATDGLRSSLNDLAGQIYGKVRLHRTRRLRCRRSQRGRAPSPPSLSDELASIDGVEAVTGLAQEFDVVAIDGNGNALDPGVGRQIGYGWPENESLSTIYVYDDGISRSPSSPMNSPSTTSPAGRTTSSSASATTSPLPPAHSTSSWSATCTSSPRDPDRASDRLLGNG